MPTFFYNAKSTTGEEKSGTYEAADKTDLARYLRQQNLFLISANILGQKSQKKHIKIILTDIIDKLQPISLVDKMLFARHLSVMIKAGLSLNQALEVLSQQTKNRKFSKIINNLNKSVQKGTMLSDALANYPKTFSNLFVSMVRVGESGGKLEESLRLLAGQIEKDHRLISKVKGAMAYPLVIVVAMFGIGVLMMITVVPNLVKTFQELKIDLPLTTRVIIALSEFLTKYTYLSLLIVILFILIFAQILKTKIGKRAFDWSALNLPIINTATRKINSARLARTLSSLIASGVSIIKSLQVVSEVLTNGYYAESLQFAGKEIEKGKSLSDSFQKYSTLYPPLIIQMVKVGEKTGTLNDILDELANFYEEETDDLTKNLSSIIEPVLMVIIGGAVGFFAISMIQPMYSMVSSF